MSGAEVSLDDVRVRGDGVARRARRAARATTTEGVRLGQGRVQRRGVPRPVARGGAGAARAGQGVDADEGRARLPRDHVRRSSTAGSGCPASTPARSPSSRRATSRPTSHETHSVTTRLIAPDGPGVRHDAEQRAELVARFLAAEELCCQLFSEPGAGSDLAALAVPGRARRRRVGRQRPEGVELGGPVRRVGRADRPLRPRRRQAQGPHRVHHPDGPARHRGPPDQADERRVVVQRGVLHRRARARLDAPRAASATGWKVALTTLGFERDRSDGAGGGGRVGGFVAAAARHGPGDGRHRRSGRSASGWPRSYTHERIERFLNRRAADLRRAGGAAGPEGSLGKLLWTERA